MNDFPNRINIYYYQGVTRIGLHTSSHIWPKTTRDIFRRYLATDHFRDGRIYLSSVEDHTDFTKEVTHSIVDEMNLIQDIGPVKIYKLITGIRLTVTPEITPKLLRRQVDLIFQEPHILVDSYRRMRELILESPEKLLNDFYCPSPALRAPNLYSSVGSLRRTFTRQDVLRLREWLASTGEE